MILPDTDQLASATIGARIQRLRLKQSLSVRDLADKAGVDKNTVLRVEKGLSVSGRTLERVCGALGVYVSRLLLPEPGEEETVVIHRRAKETWWPYPGMGDPFPDEMGGEAGGVPVPKSTDATPRGEVASLEARLPRGKMRSSLLRLWEETTPNAHPGEEFVFCVSGAAILRIAGQEYPLGEGDAANFYCAEPHTYAPASDSSPADSGENSFSTLPVLLLTVWHDSQE
ncbi:MAG: helix-turn-helix transcriptional regulator [Armatimonadetes bacterium]|nr:helix-turn-helix transcriptional regulator [Armatimonadota bacterium]